MNGAGWDDDICVDEGALAVGGPGSDLGEVGVERDTGVRAGTGPEQVGDVQGAVGGGDVNAEWLSRRSRWNGDGVVACLKGESAPLVRSIILAGPALMPLAEMRTSLVGVKTSLVTSGVRLISVKLPVSVAAVAG